MTEPRPARLGSIMEPGQVSQLRRVVAALLATATAVVAVGTVVGLIGALEYPRLMPRSVAMAALQFKRPLFIRRGWTVANGMKIFPDPADDVITPYLLVFGVWEPGLTSILRERLRPGQTFVDVGANVGYYTLLAAKLVGPTGRVIAFEPVPAEFELMRRGVEANGFRRGVELEQEALSNKRGALDLYLSPVNKGNNSIVPTRGESHVSVPAITLDEDLGAGTHVDFIKMDIEGGEGFAFEGMQQTLRGNPAIELDMEFEPWSLEHAGYSPRHLLDLITGDGFILHMIDENTGALVPVSPEQLLQAYAGNRGNRDFHLDLWLSREQNPPANR